MDAGRQLGHYTIVRLLGRGGMGEVYVAQDARLNRKVALKVLPASAAADPGRLERFRREAQAVAALSHPCIVTVHSVEEAAPSTGQGAVHFITMELVEGRTLDAVIPDGGMPLEPFFSVAIQVAGAVAAAHERGIVHRDLKPANIMVTADDRVKVLDFGLAKLLEPAPHEAETVTVGQQLTNEGCVLGTAAYMSPEQAEGQPIDHRTDIFSLGVVLYQMATGRQPFTGDTRLSVLSAIVRDTPAPVTELNASLPRHLARIIRKALEKRAAKRYQLAVELRNDLEELKHEIESGEVVLGATGVSDPEVSGVSVSPRRTGRHGSLAIVAVCFVTGALALWHGWMGPPPGPPLATPSPFTTSGDATLPAVSPDGGAILYTRMPSTGSGGPRRTFRQETGDRTAIQIASDMPAFGASFHPDGSGIAFVAVEDRVSGIWRAGSMGGDRRRVSDARASDFDWSPDGTRMAATADWQPPFLLGRSQFPLGNPLLIIDVETGAETRLDLGTDDARHTVIEPAWSPGGHRIAYSTRFDIWTVTPAGGEPVPVTMDRTFPDFSPVWSPDGRWLYYCSIRESGPGIWRVAIDERTGRTRDEPQLVRSTGTGLPAHLGISRNGRLLVYSEQQAEVRILGVDFDSTSLQVTGVPETVMSTTEDLAYLEVSPDGRWLAYLAGFGLFRDLYVKPADGSRDGSDARRIMRGVFLHRWSPDSKRVAYVANRTGDEGGRDVWVVDAVGGSGNRRVSNSPAGVQSVVWSPDGTAIAYSFISPETGVFATHIIKAELTFDQQEPVQVPAHEHADGQRVGFRVEEWGPDEVGLFAHGHTYLPTNGEVTHSPDCHNVRYLSDRRSVCGSAGHIYNPMTRTGQDLDVAWPDSRGLGPVRVPFQAASRAYRLERRERTDIITLRLEESERTVHVGWLGLGAALLILSLGIGAGALRRHRR